MVLEVTSCTADWIFQSAFTACKGDPEILLLDVRAFKDFKKQHIVHSFCVRVPNGGGVLLDYTQASYQTPWSDAVWWDKHCIVYGTEDLKKDHPVAVFLAKDGHARSVRVFRDGFAAFAQAYPFLCTAGVRTQVDKVYPSQVEPYLYLGNWGHAEATERLAELGVKGITTIHNNPERLKPPAGVRHLQIQLADVETEEIAPWLAPVHEFIETVRAKGGAVLVHCGAGVSRSATLCIGHLMRRHGWAAERALEHVKQRRSITLPNDGFWKALCNLEAELGVADRSNPNAFEGVHGRDWHADQPTEQAKATFIAEGHRDQSKEERTFRRSRSRDRQQRRRGSSRSRSRSRSRDRYRRGGSSSRSPPREGWRAEHRTERGRARTHAAAASGPVLELFKGGEKLGTLVLDVSTLSQECIFGRLPTCGVPMDHLSISRHHAKLSMDASGAYFLTDLGSSHGSNVDGAWIRPQAPRKLSVGSVLRFGASTREYRVKELPQKRA